MKTAAASSPEVRPGRRRRSVRRLSVTRARRFAQGLSLLLFVFLLVVTVHPVHSAVPVDTYLRIDPLVAIAATIAERSLTGYALWAIPLVLTTVIVGRFFCGWLCPLGTTLDITNPGRQRLSTHTAGYLRPLKHILLGTILTAALLGNLTLLAFDPLALLTRVMATAVLPIISVSLSSVQAALYGIEWLSPLALVMEDAFRGNLLPYEPRYIQQGIVMLALLGGVLALNLLAPRFWCRFVCPLGALLSILGRAGLLSRRVREQCSGCGRCPTACTMGAISSVGFESKPGECIQCARCRDVCAHEGISFATPSALPRYDPSRRQFLAAVGIGIAGVGGLRVDPAQVHRDPTLVRPPGALEEGFLARCVRCGECMKVCPTGALQPSLFQSGLEGLWSPTLVARVGYCDWSCTACGQVCPTGAIQPLSLDIKRRTYIATAYIDQNRCLPWADMRACIVCEEMCPVAEKAIVLEEAELRNDRGQLIRVKRPRVIRERCVGCGICEYRCPLPNDSAIRISGTNRFLVEQTT